MKQWGGWTFPASEQHLVDWMQQVDQRRDGRHQYQQQKYRTAIALCRTRRVAIDVGANIGLWSWPMSLDFERVYAFEPVPLYAECWRRNMSDRPNAALDERALGAEDGWVDMACFTPWSCGDTRVQATGETGDRVAERRPLVRLDDVSGLEGVDLLKLDCEGYELFALRGAQRLLLRERPVVIVEQKPGKAKAYGLGDTDAVDYLRSLGMSLYAELAGDYIMRWPE